MRCWLILLSAKVLIQIEESNQHIPVQIFSQAKPKDPPSDAFPAFVALYKNHEKVGMITKEKHSGKVVDEWNKLIKDEDVKVEVVDMSYAVSAFMAVKDEEELVSLKSSDILISLFNGNVLEMDAHSCKFKFDLVDPPCCRQVRANSRQGDQDYAPVVCGPN
jgi:nucleosome binding factor SPN SPT16 subunit